MILFSKLTVGTFYCRLVCTPVHAQDFIVISFICHWSFPFLHTSMGCPKTPHAFLLLFMSRIKLLYSLRLPHHRRMLHFRCPENLFLLLDLVLPAVHSAPAHTFLRKVSERSASVSLFQLSVLLPEHL